MSQFNVPPEWVNTEIEVSLNMPMQDAKGNLSFPTIKGMLVLCIEGAVVVAQNAPKTGKLLIPHKQIHTLFQTSLVQTLPGGLLIKG